MRLRINRGISKLIHDVRGKGAEESCSTDQETISWDDLKELYRQSTYASRGIRLKDVCQGSSIYFPASAAQKKPGKSPELVKHLDTLQRKLEQKQYDAMVKDVTAGERRAREQEGVSFGGYKEQIRFGAHVMSMMAVFFMFGYSASYRVFQSQSHRILCGIVLMFCGMIMETILLILKENKGPPATTGKTRMNFPTSGGGVKPHQA